VHGREGERKGGRKDEWVMGGWMSDFQRGNLICPLISWGRLGYANSGPCYLKLNTAMSILFNNLEQQGLYIRKFNKASLISWSNLKDLRSPREVSRSVSSLGGNHLPVLTTRKHSMIKWRHAKLVTKLSYRIQFYYTHTHTHTWNGREG
jgi:hypothetical protein